MPEKDRVNELNRRLRGQRSVRQNVSTMDANLRAIERLVSVAADDAGLISVYRALDESEKAALKKNEPDEIANAYHVEFAGENKVHYITYKPQVEKGAQKSALEHVNRSTPFVQTLLEKVGNEYSFLYCRSSVSSASVPLPPAAKGFTCKLDGVEHLEGKNKYELFFLIECKDAIDAGERLTNIIDSVLLDVDGRGGDLFARMSYASLKHESTENDAELPQVDPAVQNQLNDIILQIRESPSVRQKILDFLVHTEESELYAHMQKRNEAYLGARAAGAERNALNSAVTCRMVPIGVFLNEIDNDRWHYTVTAKNGTTAEFTTEINPTVPFSEHRCPHCGRPLDEQNGILAVSDGQNTAVGCAACAEMCSQKNCDEYVFKDKGCAVCGKLLCGKHARKSAESNDVLCPECARVFRDGASGKPLAPRDAALRGYGDRYVEEETVRLGKAAALRRFKGVKLLSKRACVRCKTSDGYKYYLPSESAACDKCGENVHKKDRKKSSDTGLFLCSDCRLDCACGSTVTRENARFCAHEGCTHGFCAACAEKATPTNGYAAAVRRMGKDVPQSVQGKLYCREHTAVCKVCGAAVPVEDARVCPDCGGIYCVSCGKEGKCATCATADTVTAENYKKVSSKTRLMRLNALSLREKLGKTAVIEDNETVVFVTVYNVFRGTKTYRRTHNKRTGKTEVWR